jgi:hypothetical protein
MPFKKRTTGAVTAAATVGLGAAYGRVFGYNVFSSADTSVSIACVDADGKTIFTEGSADFTNTTGKDGVERVLEAETRVTEDGTSATGNAGGPGVWAHGPLTITPSGVGSGTVTVDVYVEV